MTNCKKCQHHSCFYAGADRILSVECGTYTPPHKPKKSQTNADRIRAMSDEEMVDLFRYRGCPPDRFTGKCVKVGVCEACWVEWLKQPAEEETT